MPKTDFYIWLGENLIKQKLADPSSVTNCKENDAGIHLKNQTGTIDRHGTKVWKVISDR
jgi:hypothetical protein